MTLKKEFYLLFFSLCVFSFICSFIYSFNTFAESLLYAQYIASQYNSERLQTAPSTLMEITA